MSETRASYGKPKPAKLPRETLVAVRALDAIAKCDIAGRFYGNAAERKAAYAWGVRRWIEALRLAARATNP